MATKKKTKKKTKKRLDKPKFIVITDNSEDRHENNLAVKKFRTEEQLKAFLIEFSNSTSSDTIEIYKLGQKIEYTVQTNVEHLVDLSIVGK